MSTTTNFETLAGEILAGVGGPANVAAVTHCATRLRFSLRNLALADKDAISALPGVITVLVAGGQFQVVIGATVNKVHAAVLAQTESTPAAGTEVIEAGEAPKVGIGAKIIDLITGIFTPFLPVLAGAGLLSALMALLTRVFPDLASASTILVLQSATDAVFRILPILLAITAAKKFGANPFIAVAIAGSLMATELWPIVATPEGTLTLSQWSSAGGDLNFLGLPILLVPYVSSVMPIIVATWIQSKFETFFKRILPTAIEKLALGMLLLVTVLPLTLLIIGPLTYAFAGAIAAGVNALLAASPMFAGVVLGGFWQLMVVFGVHWGMVPVMIQDLTLNGYSLMSGPLYAGVMAQGGAALAVWLRTRNTDLKAVAGPAALTATIAGITEPAIYGVTLKLKRPFIAAIIAGGIGGAIASIGGVGNPAFIIPSLLTMAGATIGSFTMLAISMAVGFFGAFVLTLLFGFKDPANPAPAATTESVTDAEINTLLDSESKSLASA